MIVGVSRYDHFILYGAVHGIPVEARGSRQLGYLPLTSSSAGSIASMLAMLDILPRTDLIDAKQVLHVLDTCFRGVARLPEPQVGRCDLTVELLFKPARYLLTATRGAEQPDDELGPRTRMAIINFQRSIGLPATG